MSYYSLFIGVYCKSQWKSLRRFRYRRKIHFSKNLMFVALLYRFPHQITSLFFLHENTNMQIGGPARSPLPHLRILIDFSLVCQFLRNENRDSHSRLAAQECTCSKLISGVLLAFKTPFSIQTTQRSVWNKTKWQHLSAALIPRRADKALVALKQTSKHLLFFFASRKGNLKQAWELFLWLHS